MPVRTSEELLREFGCKEHAFDETGGFTSFGIEAYKRMKDFW